MSKPLKPVAVVDDDESVRDSLAPLLRVHGFEVETFSSGVQFLASDIVGQFGCLVLDVAMPGMTGPELQRTLIARDMTIPIIFITAHSHDGLGGATMNRGVVACLLKPFSEAAIVEAVRAGLAFKRES